MYGKYGKVIGSRGLNLEDKRVSDTYGFSTPKKKNAMLERTASVLSATKKTPVSKALERMTPVKSPSRQKRGSSRSAPTTPTSNSATPTKDTPIRRIKLRGDGPPTPKVVLKRLSKKIFKVVEEEEGSDFNSSDSSEDEDENESSDESAEDEEPAPVLTPSKRGVKRNLLKSNPATPTKPASTTAKPTKRSTRRKVAAAAAAENTDDYFQVQQGAIHTSDKTLSELKTPRLAPEVLRDILGEEKLKFASEIDGLVAENKAMFNKWLHLMSEGFNMVLYGLGSKRNLLSEFHSEKLSDKDVVVVNGFFPSLTVKHILSTIIHDILEAEETVGVALSDQVDYICKSYSSMEDQREDGDNDLYLIVHNIDGAMLRNEVAQSQLARLASQRRIHLICSVDHINAPLLWDQHKMSKMNLIWHDATTFLPYAEETLTESSLMVRSGGGKLALHSLLRVYESLTSNAREIYQRIVQHQIKAIEEHGAALYSGLAFQELYRQCRAAFLVNSDLNLRSQLTEFKDHDLLKIRTGADGMDKLVIPLDSQTLNDFVEATP